MCTCITKSIVLCPKEIINLIITIRLSGRVFLVLEVCIVIYSWYDEKKKIHF